VEPRKTLPGTIGETVSAIEQRGGTAVAVACDITDEDDLRRLVETAVATFGRLDVLVNNAADTLHSDTPVEAYPIDTWRRQFDANVHARLLTTNTCC
jgi:NAD(P)-dependent dehydrogenase (short-subunit alcohol dehydrogenase family)